MIKSYITSPDYLVDEGTECNATSDLLLERNREESLIALLIPSLVLLNNLLQKLQVCTGLIPVIFCVQLIFSVGYPGQSGPVTAMISNNNGGLSFFCMFKMIVF